MKTNSEIHQIVDAVLAKYQKRGGSFKLFYDIFFGENIKYKEVNSQNPEFVGALTQGINGQKYIMVNANIDNIGRKNFTIAHELGHYFLKHKLMENYNYCSINDISEEGQHNDPIEREANYFASCFLMPEAKIKPAFSRLLENRSRKRYKDFLLINKSTYNIWKPIRDELTKRYGVSEAALRYRLQQLKVVRFEF